MAILDNTCYKWLNSKINGTMLCYKMIQDAFLTRLGDDTLNQRKNPDQQELCLLQFYLFTIYFCCTQAILNLKVTRSFSLKILYGGHPTVLEGQIQEFGTSTNITGNFYHSLPWLLQVRIPSSLQVVLGFCWLVCLGGFVGFVCLVFVLFLFLNYNYCPV